MAVVVVCASRTISPGRSLAAEPAASDLRVFERTPFDVIVLADKKGTRVEVEPIDLAGSRLAKDHKPHEKLEVRLLAAPDQRYEILWRDIAEIQRFEQVILAEAQSLVQQGRNDEAYDDFDYLLRYFPRMEGLAAAVDRYLFADAESEFRGGHDERALASLDTLYERHAGFPGLQAKLEEIVVANVTAELKRDHYRAARRWLDRLERQYPDSGVVLNYRRQMQDSAKRLVDEGRRQFEAGQWRKAQEAARRAVLAWPGDKAARQLWADAHDRYPVIAVGVTELATLPSDRLDDWAARRAFRLVERMLFEPTGYSDEGAKYTCPLGQLNQKRLGLGLSIRLREDLSWTADAPLTGYDVARQLHTRVEPNRPDGINYWPAWIKELAVRDVYEIDLALRAAQLRPEALLRTAITPWRYPRLLDTSQAALGPYRKVSHLPDSAAYRAREGYFAAKASQPREIIERRYADSSAALRALASGEVAVVDRIPPWQATKITADGPLALESYAGPMVHCLMVTGDDPRLANRTFRRAILYAIDRETVLREHILQGGELPGCRVVSGPLPWGYAYDPNIAARPYDPALAIVLGAVARRQIESEHATDDHGATDDNSPPKALVKDKLVLAHPADDVARLACRVIQQQLARVGIPITLKELHGSAPEMPYDLRYVELAMWEPLVDLPRLLGEGTPSRRASAYLRQSLERLAQAGDWNEARRRLREIHRILHDELQLIGLWQLSEHFVYRRGLLGIGSRPMTLYDHVESWRGAQPLVAEVRR